jgi:hypothetical protein
MNILRGRAAIGLAAATGFLAGMIIVNRDAGPQLEPGAITVPDSVRAIELESPILHAPPPKGEPRWPAPASPPRRVESTDAPADDPVTPVHAEKEPPPDQPPEPPEPPTEPTVAPPCEPIDVTIDHGADPVPEHICVNLAGAPGP